MASTAVPTGSSVTESAVIEAPLSVVWRFFKLQNFATFWTKLSASEYPEGAAAGTDIFVWTFKDGTVLEVKQEEYSVGSRHIFSLQAPTCPCLPPATYPLVPTSC